jgi:hypothetical protein
MVAKITISKSIEAALNYNEKKVQKKNAICLYAANYLNDIKNMNFYQKLDGFERLNNLNERAATNTLHASLNFDPSEKLSDSRLTEIGLAYMDKIGFDGQPFLIYKHEDAGHPHIHIVSTTIKGDGSRINTHNIGRNQSEKARKEIELQFGLIKAQRQQKLLQPGSKPLNIEKAIYGKSETKKSIANVVGAVFSQYNFTSLPEFNAALKQFNVIADRGKEEGWIYKKRGLIFRILDAEGNKLGVPIKASSIGCKPTLNNLEKKFITNSPARDAFKHRTKIAIEECLQSPPNSMKDLVIQLERKQIYTVLRKNAEGRLYGITFVDNLNKCVFNGSDLGKNYSIASLQNRLVNIASDTEKINVAVTKKPSAGYKPLISKNVFRSKHKQPLSKTENLLLELLSTKEQMQNVPFDLIKKKRKKKKKNI